MFATIHYLHKSAGGFWLYAAYRPADKTDLERVKKLFETKPDEYKREYPRKASPVYQTEILGEPTTYILSDKNRMIWKQKRRCNYEVWANRLMKNLKKVGFTENMISDIWEDCNDRYYNVNYYDKVQSVVQEQLDLGFSRFN